MRRRKKLPVYAFYGVHLFVHDAIRLFGVDAPLVSLTVFYNKRYYGTYLCSFMTSKILSMAEIHAYRSGEGQFACDTSSESSRTPQTRGQFEP